LSFGDVGLLPESTYNYFIKAVDQAGNTSAPSITASAATNPEAKNSSVKGAVSSPSEGTISAGTVSTVVNGFKKTYALTSKGNYLITDLSSGTYSIKFSAPGFDSKTESVVVGENQTITKNIQLMKKEG
jgi:hypothetical protein